MQIKPKEFLYVPNLLSLLRLLLILPIAYYIRFDTPFAHNMVIILVLIAASTDFLDGFFSRRLNQVTDLGQILDPLADKIDLGIGLILLVIYRDFPLPLAVYLIYRDILILILGAACAKKLGHPTPANFWGKLNTTIVSIAGILYLTGWAPLVAKIAIVASYGVILVSGISYALLGQKILFTNRWPKLIYWLVLFLLTLFVVLSTINYKFV
ncbi:CDP-alcohol phosphatidyltransferase family protein [Calditrichota bacterium GD2]